MRRDSPARGRPGPARRWALLTALGLAACGAERPGRGAKAVEAGRTLTPGTTVAVLTDATVVAFWLKAADTIPADVRRRVREEFRRSNLAVADYLSDTDVGIVATVNDTVIVQLESGARRLVMLSGLDFPYGYVFIEPGYAEEFHTGLAGDDDLEGAIDDYFGLEDDTPQPRRHIASFFPPSRHPVLLDILFSRHEGSASHRRTLDARRTRADAPRCSGPRHPPLPRRSPGGSRSCPRGVSRPG